MLRKWGITGIAELEKKNIYHTGVVTRESLKACKEATGNWLIFQQRLHEEIYMYLCKKSYLEWSRYTSSTLGKRRN